MIQLPQKCETSPTESTQQIVYFKTTNPRTLIDVPLYFFVPPPQSFVTARGATHAEWNINLKNHKHHTLILLIYTVCIHLSSFHGSKKKKNPKKKMKFLLLFINTVLILDHINLGGKPHFFNWYHIFFKTWSKSSTFIGAIWK